MSSGDSFLASQPQASQRSKNWYFFSDAYGPKLKALHNQSISRGSNEDHVVDILTSENDNCYIKHSFASRSITSTKKSSFLNSMPRETQSKPLEENEPTGFNTSMRDLPKLSMKKIDLGHEIANDTLSLNNLNLEL